jgi:hypothetical protein
MTTVIDRVMSDFMEAIPGVIRRDLTPDIEREFGTRVQNLYLVMKQATEVIRYYEMGGTDGGAEAKKFLYSGQV